MPVPYTSLLMVLTPSSDNPDVLMLTLAPYGGDLIVLAVEDRLEDAVSCGDTPQTLTLCAS